MKFWECARTKRSPLEPQPPHPATKKKMRNGTRDDDPDENGTAPQNPKSEKQKLKTPKSDILNPVSSHLPPKHRARDGDQDLKGTTNGKAPRLRNISSSPLMGGGYCVCVSGGGGERARVTL